MKSLKINGQSSYPTTILIGKDVWEVKFCREIADGCLGLTDANIKTIYLKQKQDKKSLLKIFIHEILHGICDSYGFNIPHKTIYELEGPLVNLIVDNFSSISKILGQRD